MQPTEIISKKKAGIELSEQELAYFLNSFLEGKTTDYQMSAWLMAVCFRGMSEKEQSIWTRLMWQSGKSFPRANREEFWVDKHSTGGVGDKTSLLLVPLVAAVGQRLWGSHRVKLPMISGRGLGHTGGTLDKLESVPGFSPKVSFSKSLELLQSNDFFMIGQTDEIAPADRRIYALRDATSTVDSIPLIVSSILSKKLSESLDGIVFDVKVGNGAFMTTVSDARKLAEGLISQSKLHQLKATAVITKMDEPLGVCVGNFLEVEECWDFLNGDQEPQLKELVLELAAHMLSLSSRGSMSKKEAKLECEKELSSEKSRDLFKKMFISQGGDWKKFEERYRKCPETHVEFEIRANKTGFLKPIDALKVGQLVNVLGGGRMHVDQNIDSRVGLRFEKKAGNPVVESEVLIRGIAKDEESANGCKEAIQKLIEISETEVKQGSIIIEVIQ